MTLTAGQFRGARTTLETAQDASADIGGFQQTPSGLHRAKVGGQRSKVSGQRSAVGGELGGEADQRRAAERVDRTAQALVAALRALIGEQEREARVPAERHRRHQRERRAVEPRRRMRGKDRREHAGPEHTRLRVGQAGEKARAPGAEPRAAVGRRQRLDGRAGRGVLRCRVAAHARAQQLDAEPQQIQRAADAHALIQPVDVLEHGGETEHRKRGPERRARADAERRRNAETAPSGERELRHHKEVRAGTDQREQVDDGDLEQGGEVMHAGLGARKARHRGARRDILTRLLRRPWAFFSGSDAIFVRRGNHRREG
ncbi:hypothetical protein PT2222_10235 [Paraburkholderia tropica]